MAVTGGPIVRDKLGNGAAKGKAAGARSIMEMIRSEFRACAGNREAVSAEDLARFWRNLTEEWNQKFDRGPLTLSELQAIALRAVQVLREVDVLHTGHLGVEEWVHFRLLASSGVAGKQINSLLTLAMQENRTALHDLQDLFEIADRTESGSLTLNEIMEMCKGSMWNFTPPGKSLNELGPKNSEQYARELVKSMDLDGDEKITYAEFMAFCLGRRKQEVKLYLYDLSSGAADAMSPWVVGEQLEGIWHSSIVAFGKEYYYARDTVFDDPGSTSFGKPDKVIELGHTLWRRDELHDFVVHDLKPVFHRQTYDVITNNCNHFTDRVSMFLVGHHVPDEVLRQPIFLLKSKFVRVVRPMMNWWLRDRIAQREKGKDIPMPGRGRILPGEQVAIGTVVVVHPAADGARGIPVLGHVHGAEAQHPQNSEGWHSFLDYCSCNTNCKVEQISVLGPCGTESQPASASSSTGTSELRDGFWVQYLELGKVSSANPSMAQVRMELLPRSRLSFVATSVTEDTATQATYAATLRSLGVNAKPPPGLGATKSSSTAVPGIPVLANKELPCQSPRPAAPAASPGPVTSPVASEVRPDALAVEGATFSLDRGMRILQL
jgi:hypothetical protein